MNAERDFHELHFDSIQALRGIAALFVVMEHIPFLVRGAFGVDIFFCISGFMIMFATHKSTKYFFRKRFLRIVPFYYLATLGTYFMLLLYPGIFEATTAEPANLVKSLLFLPFYIGDAIQPLVKIGWTVNYEIFFYLLFGLSFRISHKYRGAVCAVLLMGLAWLGTVLPPEGAVWEFYSDPIILEFALGILSYYLAWFIYRCCQKMSEQKRLMNAKILAYQKILSYLCIPAAAWVFYRLYQGRYSFDIRGFGRFEHWGYAGLILVLLFFTAGLYVKIPKWLVMLGNISFSIYLLHYYPLRFVDQIICDLSVRNTKTVTIAILTVAAVIALSYVTWYWIEQRFTNWLRARVIKKEETAAK